MNALQLTASMGFMMSVISFIMMMDFNIWLLYNQAEGDIQLNYGKLLRSASIACLSQQPSGIKSFVCTAD